MKDAERATVDALLVDIGQRRNGHMCEAYAGIDIEELPAGAGCRRVDLRDYILGLDNLRDEGVHRLAGLLRGDGRGGPPNPDRATHILFKQTGGEGIVADFKGRALDLIAAANYATEMLRDLPPCTCETNGHR